MLPPKKQLLTSKPHSFPFVFVVCLRSVEQTNHITAMCSANTEGFPAFVLCCMPPKKRLCSQATIMTDENNFVNESAKCFMCSSMRSANERIYIF